jgi:hypothetical protein
MKDKSLQKEMIKALRKTGKSKRNDRQLHVLMDKIKNEKRLKSSEFLGLQSMLWKPGPATRYCDPDKWTQ